MRSVSQLLLTIEKEVYSYPSTGKPVRELANSLVDGSILHAARHTSTEVDDPSPSIVNAHCDWFNCNHPTNSPVYCLNLMHNILNSMLQARRALLTYSRKHLTIANQRHTRFYPLISLCEEYFKRLRQTEPHRISRGLELVNYVIQKRNQWTADQSKDGVVVISPGHINKMTWYDGVVDTILQCCNAHRLSQLQAMGLVLSLFAHTNSWYMRRVMMDYRLVKELLESGQCLESAADCQEAESDIVTGARIGFLVYQEVWKLYKDKTVDPEGKVLYQVSNHKKLSWAVFVAKFRILREEYHYFRSDGYMKSKKKLHDNAYGLMNRLIKAGLCQHLTTLHIMHVCK